MLLALLIVDAASSPTKLEGGVWLSDDRSIQIQFHGMDFVRYDLALDQAIQCQTVWPIREPQATASCEDGSRHKLYFDMKSGVIIFDDISLRQLEGEALD